MASGFRWTLTPRPRDYMVLVMAVVSGVTDASGFLHLGGVFSSVMTGTMVLLGLAGGTSDGSKAAHAGAAIAAFGAGFMIGGRVAGRHREDDGIWPAPITYALAGELAIFIVYAIALQTVAGRPRDDLFRTGLLALNAMALGLQSSAIHRFGVSGLSTTYLTGTLTTTMVHLASGRPILHVALNLRMLASLVIAAGVGGLLAMHAMRFTPALQIGGLGLVILLAGLSEAVES